MSTPSTESRTGVRLRGPRPADATTRRGVHGGRHHLGLVAAGATLLATAPLFSLFDGLRWLFLAAFAVGAVAAAAAGTRALRAPEWLQTLAMFGALAVMVLWHFRSGEERYLLVPTEATLDHLRVLLSGVPDVVANEVPPVPDHDGLLLLMMVGVGLVAIMVDLAAVGMRRPALAGLPMLAIYSVPVAVHGDSVPVFTFVLGVAGFMWLVGSDNLERVRRFGRRFTGDGRDVELWEPSPLAAAGRRLTVVGVLIAVTLPLAVPGMTGGLVERIGSGVGDGPGGTGPTRPTAVNLFATLDGQLNRDTTDDLVRVTTTDPEPSYLRVGVADRITERGFDHRAPDGDPVAEGLPAPPRPRPGVTEHRHRAEVEVLAWDMNRLPTFPALTGTTGLDDEWRYDPDQQVVFSGDTGSSGLAYEFEYVRREYEADALRLAQPLSPDHTIQRTYARVVPAPGVPELVSELTAGLENQYDRVRAILDYFSRDNGFRYSLNAGSEVDHSAIANFLFESQAGYCVQYAVGMAWMVREAGMPARVAIGFTRGSRPSGDTYVLTNRNLHAWTEVYFSGYGWVPFDATPAASIPGSIRPAWAPDPDAPDPSSPTGPGAEVPFPPGDPGEVGGRPFLDPSGEDPGVIAPAEPVNWQPWAAGGLAALLVLLVLPAARRFQLRRRRVPGRAATAAVTLGPGDPPPGVVTSAEPAAAARHRAHAAWDELRDLMIDYQVPLYPAETPRATTERLAVKYGLAPATGGELRLLGQAEERATYARTPLSPTGLGPALRAVRRALAGLSGRRTRLRAALLPPSTLLRWRTAAGNAAARVAATSGRLGEAVSRLSPRRLLHQTR